MSKDLLLFPFGGSAREALVAIMSSTALQKEWNVLGFVDDDPTKKGQACCGKKVLGGRDIFQKHKKAFVLAVPAHPKVQLEREKIIGSLDIPAKRWATVIHPSCVVSSDVTIGANTLIMPFSFLSSRVSVGDHCVLLSRTLLSHDVAVGDYGCFGPAATLSGGVTLGRNVFIGAGANIKEGLRIGDRVLVGMGANVVHGVEPGVVVVGNPARKIRENT